MATKDEGLFFSKGLTLSQATKSVRVMREYLKSHFRYDTMNSWNRAHSFAHKVKLHNLGLTSQQQDKAFEVMDVDGWWDEISWPIREFESAHNGRFTIGTNGRSGGYLVLYKSQLKALDYKSRCTACGQLNFTLVPFDQPFGKCGKCSAEKRVNLTRPLTQIQVFPGQSYGNDLDSMDASELRSMVEVVHAFDQTCSEIRMLFIELLNRDVVEQTYMVPKKRKVFKEDQDEPTAQSA
jgi:hypothetical protein